MKCALWWCVRRVSAPSADGARSVRASPRESGRRRLDLKRRDTGAPVASLDIPVALSIKVDELTVKLQPGTIKLDVVK